MSTNPAIWLSPLRWSDFARKTLKYWGVIRRPLGRLEVRSGSTKVYAIAAAASGAARPVHTVSKNGFYETHGSCDGVAPILGGGVFLQRGTDTLVHLGFDHLKQLFGV